MRVRRTVDVKRLIEAGMQQVASELEPDAARYIAHLRVRVPQGSQAGQVAQQVRAALARSPAPQPDTEPVSAIGGARDGEGEA